ncbi:MAG: helix-turn-helix transcriptional regulator [Dorea sp.]|nr:helix-turn-helix transcriptional regulator [Dorea sp.]
MKILLDKIMYDKQLSVRQVSVLTGVSKSTISRIINGKTSPTADTLELLAKGLNIRISDLIESDFK